MIKLPARYSYIEAYLTLTCNMNCHYCINSHTGVKRKRKELSAREWIAGLNNIDTNGRPITLGGGEPTKHPEFYSIVNGLREDITVDLLTNGKFDIEEFIRNVPTTRLTSAGPDYYKSIRMSYHAQYMIKEELVQKALRLQDAGFKVGIFGLNHPHNLFHNVEMTDLCSKHGVYFFVRDFLGYWEDRLYGYYKYPSALNGNKKKCLCRAQDFLIGPEGDVFRCHRDLYEQSTSVGSILNITYEVNDSFISCDNFGLCNPCDFKIKLEPDLITTKCSVEIK